MDITPERQQKREFIKLVLFSDIFVMLGYALAQIEKIL